RRQQVDFGIVIRHSDHRAGEIAAKVLPLPLRRPSAVWSAPMQYPALRANGEEVEPPVSAGHGSDRSGDSVGDDPPLVLLTPGTGQKHSIKHSTIGATREKVATIRIVADDGEAARIERRCGSVYHPGAADAERASAGRQYRLHVPVKLIVETCIW